MQAMITIHLGPARFDGDPETEDGWPGECWDEIADASFLHDDRHPQNAVAVTGTPD